MSQKNTVTAYSDADKQAAAIEQWRQRSAQHSKKIQSISKRVASHKKSIQNNRKLSAWVEERNRLNEQQDVCEGELEGSLIKISALLDDETDDTALETIRLKSHLRDQLQQARAVVQSLRANRVLRMDETTFTELVSSTKAMIARERNRVNGLEEELCSPSSSSFTYAHGSVDFDMLFKRTETRLRALREEFSGCENVREAFEAALEAEKQSILARLDTTAAPPLSFPDSVYRTMDLVVRMAEVGRHVNLQATATTEMCDRAAAALPHLSRTDIQSALSETLHIRRQKAFARTTALDYKREVDSIFLSLEDALHTYKELRRMQKEAAAESQEQEARKVALHRQLVAHREVFEEKTRARRAEEQIKEESEERRANAVQKARMQEFQMRLRELEAYEKRKAEIQEKEKLVAELRRQEEEEKRIARMQHNGERVGFREAEFEQKVRRRRALQEECLILKRRRDEALKRFFVSVDRQLGVEADPRRILQHTASSEQSESYITFAEASTIHRKGYSDEDIMRDPRVILFHALLEAGLHKTLYGREVVSRNFHVAPAQRASESNPFCSNAR